ncbi:hypothetical protein [Streptomyces sp. NPDC055210]
MSTSQGDRGRGLQAVLLNHDYKGLCWWCDSTADSREHRYKKTDVVRSFGTGPWVDGVVRVRSGKEFEERIQGPNSNKLKFEKVLCAKCNNARSQSFDRAYEVFSEFLRVNANSIVRSERFRFSAIYGKDWRDQRRQLGKYFIKNICCRLAEDKVKIPQGVISYMDGSAKELPNFILEMNVNMAKYELGIHMGDVHGMHDGSLWLGDHGIIYDGGAPSGTYSHLGFDWFNLDYQFLFDLKKGKANFFSGDLVRTPHFWPEGFGSGDVAKACRDCNPGMQSGDSENR